MHEFASQMLTVDQTFVRKEAVDWFNTHYPKIKSNTVSQHLDGLSVNNGKHREHHPHIGPDKGWDLFFKLGPSTFRLWVPENDPAPEYKASVSVAKTSAD